MRLIDLTLAQEQDICLSRIVLMSGMRPGKRYVDWTGKGRGAHGLLYIWEGEVESVHEDGSAVYVGSGDIAYIPKESRYMMRYVAESTTFVLINFQISLSDGEEVSIFDRITVMANDLSDRWIAGVMMKLEMCSASENNAAIFRRKELVYRLLSMVVSDGVQQGVSQTKHSGIVPGVQLLKQSYLENLPVEQFAQVSNMSVSSFRRQFAQVYGMSPVQYRNRLRIERAVSLLSDGNCTVTEAAYACGFDNLGYFCRCYKKHIGQTPNETRMNEL